uniref:NB-ARC domain-containing protein n=1 Tax=Leersia perrieri TaxID=77586 RepID=A0A0D9WUX6_9ORYZ
MNTLFSAILGELATRSLSMLIDKCFSNQKPSSKEENIHRLQRMLLRLAVTVEDAEGRRVTNHAMLRQLNMLRQDMHKGYYFLDTFRLQQIHEDDDNKVSYNTLAMPKFNFTKRARVTIESRREKDEGELEQVIYNLEITLADMFEFVLLLQNYPSMHRQPYNTYMFMDKCMFGRQMEMENIMNFLLHSEPPITDNLGVLPMIGPTKVGKSTLVEHVCYDERVRGHFSRIIFLSDSDFNEEISLVNLRYSGVIRHKHISSSSTSNGEERLLIVVELTEDVSDHEWRRMYYSYRSCISAGSKIIITSRSDKIAKFGTTQPLCLNFLSKEAYWYYFKVLAFGSSDPYELPHKVLSVSMAMFNAYFDYGFYKDFTGQFIDLSILSSWIQTSVSKGNWHSFREHYKEKEIHNHFVLHRCLGDSWMKSKFMFIPRRDGVHRYCEVYDHCRVRLAHEEDRDAPKIDMQDVLSGRVATHGRFDVVMWRSRLPPYYSYIRSCEIHESRSI